MCLFSETVVSTVSLRKMIGRKCSLPQRVIIAIMGFLAGMLGYATRICISVAITEMVVPLNSTKNGNETLVCPADSSSIVELHPTNINGTRYAWDQEQQGWIFSSFYIGYVISHIPAGAISQKFGGKWSMSFPILFGAIFSIATPLTIEYGGIWALIALRICYGFTSGTLFPALSVLLASWVPDKERSVLGTIALGGAQIGSVVSFYCSGLLLSYWSWPVVFYFWGVVSAGWFILFTLICYKDPESHPFISEQERNYLRSEIGQLKRQTDLPSTPWKSILTSAPVLAYAIAQMGQDWIAFVMASNLPKYFKEVLGYSIYAVGLYSSLPYLLMLAVSLVCAYLCDYLIGQKYLTTTGARKFFTVLSSASTAIFIVAASYALCNKTLVVCFFVLGLGAIGAYFPGFRLNGLDLSPNYAGSIMALTNGMGSITGVIAPIFVGMMTPNSTLDEYRFVFWVTFGIIFVRTIIYLIWGSGKVQSWNGPQK